MKKIIYKTILIFMCFIPLSESFAESGSEQEFRASLIGTWLLDSNGREPVTEIDTTIHLEASYKADGTFQKDYYIYERDSKDSLLSSFTTSGKWSIHDDILIERELNRSSLHSNRSGPTTSYSKIMEISEKRFWFISDGAWRNDHFMYRKPEPAN